MTWKLHLKLINRDILLSEKFLQTIRERLNDAHKTDRSWTQVSEKFHETSINSLLVKKFRPSFCPPPPPPPPILFPRESFVFFKSNSIDNNRPLSSVREKWNQYELRGESQVCRLRRSNAIALLNDVDNLLPRIPQIY